MIKEPNKTEIEIMFFIQQCVKALYEIDDAGGSCHIVVDDGNVDDESLQWVIDKCNESNNLKSDRFLSKCICEQLLSLKREHRIILMDMMFAPIFDMIDSAAIDIYFDSKDVDEVVNNWNRGIVCYEKY